MKITIESGKTKKLLTAGKYCDRDIEVTAEGGADTSVEDSLVTRTLTSYTNNRIKETGQSAMQGATKLVSVDWPELTKLGAYTFNGCSALTTVNVPKVTFVGNGAFASCSRLVTIELPSLTEMYAGAFSNCTKLVKVVLSGSSVATLRGAAFTNTPIVSGTGFIYVPDNLVESYKAATNWVTVASQIKPISELEG